MTQWACENAREAIPAAAVGSLPPRDRSALEEHLRDCAECAAEAGLVLALRRARPQPPVGLVDAVVARLAEDRRVDELTAAPSRGVRHWAPWWGAAAAGVAALALGVGASMDRWDGSAELDVPVYVAESSLDAPWLASDGDVAGVPSLDDLTDEELQQLMDDLGTGGAA